MGYIKITTAFTTVLVLSWTIAGWIAVTDHRKIVRLESQLARYEASTVVEHNVAILARLDNGDFAYCSDEEPGCGAWRPCPSDAKNGVQTAALLQQGIGYIADIARWEERGTCKSILRADLGFDWKNRNNNFKYTRVN